MYLYVGMYVHYNNGYLLNVIKTQQQFNQKLKLKLGNENKIFFFIEF